MSETDFFDRARIYVTGGAGGNGSASFRREKYVPFGGPDGGDGGRGGSVFLKVDSRLNTLLPFRYERRFVAGDGDAGRGKRKHGKTGDDRYVAVPPGTVVQILDEHGAVTGHLADLTETGQEVMVARGGRGGLGNTHYATSTNQAPRFAQKGEAGEERWLNLELKLIADVGLLGKPNAGKSTFLAAVTAANPKIGDYPFTTLSPNLGVVDLDDRTFVVADIPGIIEGAHSGLGLGHDFLRHVERTRVLLHLVDGSAPDPTADFEQLNRELELYDPRLAEKRQIVVVTKLDLPDCRDRLSELVLYFREKSLAVHAISAVTGEGVLELLRAARVALDETGSETRKSALGEATGDLRTVRPNVIRGLVEVARTSKTKYRVEGAQAARLVAMTDLQNYDGVQYLLNQLRRLGVIAAIERAGVPIGSHLTIGQNEFVWSDVGLQLAVVAPEVSVRSRRLKRASRDRS